MWSAIKLMVSLDGTGVDAGAKRIESSVARLSKNISSGLKTRLAAGFSAAAIAGMAAKAVQAANRIQDMADNFELTTDQVQQLDFAAKQAGSSIEGVAGNLDKMSKARADAVGGNEKVIESFSRLGLTLEDLQDEQQTSLDLFLKMASSFSGGSGNRGDLMSIFGKTGGQMANVLRSIESNSGQGVFFKEQDIQAIDALSESVDKLVQMGLGDLASVITGLVNLDMSGGDEAYKLVAQEKMTDKYGQIMGTLWRWGEWFDSNKTYQKEVENARMLDAESKFPGIRYGSTRERQNEKDLPSLLGQMARAAASRTNPEGDSRLASALSEASINDQVAQMAMDAEVKRRDALMNSSSRVDAFATDSLARVGGFVGGAGFDPSMAIATDSNRVLKMIEQHLEAIKEQSSVSGGLDNGFTY